MENAILIPLIISGILELVVCICIAKCADMLIKIEAEVSELQRCLLDNKQSQETAQTDSWVCKCGTRNSTKNGMYCNSCGRKQE